MEILGSPVRHLQRKLLQSLPRRTAPPRGSDKPSVFEDITRGLVLNPSQRTESKNSMTSQGTRENEQKPSVFPSSSWCSGVMEFGGLAWACGNDLG